MLGVVYAIYDDGRPRVEAYDGPQIAGMDLHRAPVGAGTYGAGWAKLATVRISNSPAGRWRISPGLASGRKWCWSPVMAVLGG